MNVCTLRGFDEKPMESTTMTHSQRLVELSDRCKEAMEEHDRDPYHLGFANGMLRAHSLLTGADLKPIRRPMFWRDEPLLDQAGQAWLFIGAGVGAVLGMLIGTTI